MTKRMVAGMVLILGITAAAADPRDDCLNLSGDAAIKACDEAIQQSPRDAELYHNRGTHYRVKGDTDLANADYAKADEINPFALHKIR